ncbi:MAG TPA: kynureninase [Phycisphaerales bacterium]|nr:kynureninase [Phycisphaerales bacterium]
MLDAPMERTTEDAALALDEADPLRGFRERFCFPEPPQGSSTRQPVYLCGNSLGLMPRATRDAVLAELDDWARLGVEGHFKKRDGWYRYHEIVREPLARLVGARAHEVVAMNSLTVNLHLMMASFYRPTGSRRRILIDGPCFPSDVYAVASQIRRQGGDPERDLIRLAPRAGEHTLRTADVCAAIEQHAGELALVLLAGVNYVTGQRMEIGPITGAARRAGVTIGWDLAHAAGNVPLSLHEWGPDFAVWCSYKYLNSGPGSVAGCFVHERHTRGAGEHAFRQMPRCEGWWGNDPDTRFAMTGEFTPVRSADAWQLSNPPIFSLTPLKVSLGLFELATMVGLRHKSQRLTGYLESLLTPLRARGLEIVTPSGPDHRGCQLSLLVSADGRALHRRLTESGVVCDFREPSIIRLAPTPLYNSFHDCWRAAGVLREALA